MDPDDTEGPSSSDGLQQDWSEYREPSIAIVETVAEFLDCDETDLPPLHDGLDTDALNALLSGNDGVGIRVGFEYAGVWVMVGGDGTILVRQSP